MTVMTYPLCIIYGLSLLFRDPLLSDFNFRTTYTGPLNRHAWPTHEFFLYGDTTPTLRFVRHMQLLQFRHNFGPSNGISFIFSSYIVHNISNDCYRFFVSFICRPSIRRRHRLVTCHFIGACQIIAIIRFGRGVQLILSTQFHAVLL